MIKMVITDLDGTLLNPNQEVHADDYSALKFLGEAGVVRVVATGRSPHSFKKVISEDFPIDYLIFSSGAGIMEWATKHVLESHSLSQQELLSLFPVFIEEGISFKVLAPSPENHNFWYLLQAQQTEDFHHRMRLYNDFGKVLEMDPPNFQTASQLLVILPNDEDLFNRLSSKCYGVKVIRATSPLDHQSIWMEVFPSGVSKGAGVNSLCASLGIAQENTLGIGNDYNDIDLLNFTEKSYLLENGPEVLKPDYLTAPSNEEGGFSWVVSQYFTGI